MISMRKMTWMAVVVPAIALGVPAVSAQTKPQNTATKPAAAKPAAQKPKAKPAASRKPVAAAKPAKGKATTAGKTGSRAAVAAGAGAATAGAVAAAQSLRADPLQPEQVALAQQVHTGRIACELGASVDVTPDANNPGYFHLKGKGFSYHMSPVVTSTGALRLEDQRAGAVWIQIANKSMLMNQKLGQRLADECMSPQQVLVADAIKKTPPPSLLEPVNAPK